MPHNPAHGTIPLAPNGEYDLPAGPHVGGAAALRVPCSDGRATFLLARGDESNESLIEMEPGPEPSKLMEAGVSFTPVALHRIRAVFRPIRSHRPR